MHVALMAVSAATAPTGVCRHAANLARSLQSIEGVDQVTLITGAWQADYFERLFDIAGDRLRVVSIDIPNNSFSRNRWYLLRLPTVAHALDADILHLTFPVPFLRSTLLVPTVLTLHDLYPLDLPRNFGAGRARLNRLALRTALHNADVTVCVSSHTQQRLGEAYPRLLSPAITIPHPIARLDTAGGAALPPELESHPFLLCIAQHRANKNLLVLVRGFHTAIQTRVIADDARLVIVGNEGPETKALLREIAVLGLSNRVRLLRGLPDVMLAKLYQRCELFVAPSILEGFGLPVAEASVHGCRMLCTDIPAFREMGVGGCMLIPANADAAQLTAGMAAALTLPRSVRNNNHFLSPLQTANRYLTVYQSLLQSKGHRFNSVTPSEKLSTGDA